MLANTRAVWADYVLSHLRGEDLSLHAPPQLYGLTLLSTQSGPSFLWWWSPILDEGDDMLVIRLLSWALNPTCISFQFHFLATFFSEKVCSALRVLISAGFRCQLVSAAVLAPGPCWPGLIHTF